MPFRANSDISLVIDGDTLPLTLYVDDQGNKQLGDGLAPMVAPQFRTSGFGYEHVPPEIEVIEAFENFYDGCGFSDQHSHENNVHHRHYAYASGLDLSWGDRAFVELKRNAATVTGGGAIAAAPTKFFYSPVHGLFMLAGAYIYEWVLATTSWTLRDDASADVASYTDMAEIDGTLVALRGSTVDYKTSTDGITWAAFTAEDENGDYAVNRGNASDIAVLWKVNDHIIKANPAPGSAGWVGSDEVGNSSETTRGACVVDNTIFVFKDKGFYTYDGTNTDDVWKTTYIDSYNGKHPLVWRDGKVYAPYGRRLHSFNPYGAEEPHQVVFPTQGMDSLQVLGTITALAGDDSWVYMAVKTYSGTTRILRGSDTGGEWAWHTIKDLGANDCEALAVVGPGVLHATNPGYVFGYGTAAHYVILPQQDLLPSEDSVCTFETAEGTAYFTNVDFGAQTYPKFLNRGSVLGFDLDVGQTATLAYQTDRGTETVDIVTAEDGPLTEADVVGDVSFHVMRPVLKMQTSDSSTTPQVDAIAFGATLNPVRKRVWRPLVVLSDGLKFRDGTDQENEPSASYARGRLFDSVRKRMVLVDRDQVQHTVRLLDIEPVALRDGDAGDDERETSVYRLVLVQINALN